MLKLSAANPTIYLHSAYAEKRCCFQLRQLVLRLQLLVERTSPPAVNQSHASLWVWGVLHEQVAGRDFALAGGERPMTEYDVATRGRLLLIL